MTLNLIYIYICKTQIRVWPKICVITSYSDPCPSKTLSPQICVLLCHTQIYVLSKTYFLRSVSSNVILRSVSSNVILRSISSKMYVPSDLSSDIIYRSRYYVKMKIPTDLCPPHFGQRGKKTFIVFFFFLLRKHSRHRVYCPVPPSFQMPTSNDVINWQLL